MKLSLNGAFFALAVSTLVASVQAVCTTTGAAVSKNGCDEVTCGFTPTTGSNGNCFTPTECAHVRNQAVCSANSTSFTGAACSWEGTGSNQHCEKAGGHGVETNCLQRGTQTQAICEADDRCQYRSDKGVKSCDEVNLGTATVGEVCQSKLFNDTDGAYYVDVEGKGCVNGAMCVIDKAFPEASFNYPINGTCQSTECIGKKVPGNCNGNKNIIDYKDQCNATTERVTICHRTCSRKNPWVRITIDEDAWDGEGCGHQQHDIRDECANKAPWSEWGPNRRDYLLVRHGTRAQVEDKLGLVYNNGALTAAVKAYWRKWEPACPYVRNGACCNWFDTEDDFATRLYDKNWQPCCGGEQGLTALQPVAAIHIKKYAALDTALCNADTIGMQDSPWEDIMLTLTPNSNEQWKYCYVVSVPNVTTGTTVNECLNNALMTDADATIGGINDTEIPNIICPGETKYFTGPVVTGRETEHEAKVCGTGADSQVFVCSTDAASVVDSPVPDVHIKTYAGPWGSCPKADAMQNCDANSNCVAVDGYVDDVYDSHDGKFKYCYVITVRGNECLLSASMVHNVTGGIVGPFTLGTDGKVCPGEVFVLDGPDSTTTEDLNTGLAEVATVVGTGEDSWTVVTSTDPAGVDRHDYSPAVTIKKWAGPHGQCPDEEYLMESLFEDDEYTTDHDKDYMYCYYIKNTGDECLNVASMNDPATQVTYDLIANHLLGSDNALFCPDKKIIITGPAKYTVSGEDSVAATVDGTGQYTGTYVKAADPAKVLVPQCTPMPGKPASEFCPDYPDLQTIVLENTIGAPEAMAMDIIYDLQSVDGGESVKFKVASPFQTGLNMFVQYHKPTTTGGGGWSEDCYSEATGACKVASDEIEADCLTSGTSPFTLIQVYFAANENNPPFVGGSAVDECCDLPTGTPARQIVAQYTFILRCACPTAERRLLWEVDEKIDVEKVRALFAK